MKTDKSPILVKYKPNLSLIVISADPGNGKGEQTIMTLTPLEAVRLGVVLADMGRENGGVTAE